MLKMTPNCERCDAHLPAHESGAWICSYECTFCAICVDGVLQSVCPNCGGNFMPRPIRPAHNRKGGNYLGKDPATTVVRHQPVDLEAHAALVAAVGHIPPHER